MINPIRHTNINNPLKNTNTKLINTKRFLAVFSLVLVLISGLPATTQAAGASLYLSPFSGSYTVGKTFSVTVGVNTDGTAINAVEGSLSFNNSLEVVSISKSGSILNLWVQEPTYSNSSRVISFGGGVPNPGFTGSGRIFTVTFKGVSIRTGTVNFSSGRVLANDGKGTNILAGMGSGNYTIKEASVQAIAPSQPAITFSTHPDQNEWYQNNNPQFSWELFSGVTAVSFSFSQEEKSNPDSISEGLINSKTYENVEDGIWYFHLKFQNKNGWGPSAHYRVQIDNTSPQGLEVIVDNGGDSTNPQPILLFKAIDAMSGIDYYEIKMGGESVKVNQDSYQIPLQSPNKYQTIVKVFDRAGNYDLKAIDIIIEPIETPVITEYPEILNFGDLFYLKGKSLPE